MALFNIIQTAKKHAGDAPCATIKIAPLTAL
jgi:hypothetical protein